MIFSTGHPKSLLDDVLTLVLVPIVSLVLGGCATVYVSGSDAKVSQGFGVVRVDVQPSNSAPQLVTTQGFGIVVASRSLTIGVVQESVATFPDSSGCRVMIVVQSSTEFEALQRVLIDDPARLGNICVTKKEGATWSH